jgi:hypothetical protein
MFIVSFRLSPKKVLVAALALGVVVTASVTAANILRDRAAAAETISDEVIETRKTEKTEAENEDKIEIEAGRKINPKKAVAKTNDARLEFIRGFGWEVDAEPAEVMEVIIPKEFDDVYEEYNSMQKTQGLNLEPFAGKRCKRYSYNVTNHPRQQEDVRVNLLMQGSKIVGGDVCSLTPGGFMHGLIMEE